MEQQNHLSRRERGAAALAPVTWLRELTGFAVQVLNYSVWVVMFCACGLKTAQEKVSGESHCSVPGSSYPNLTLQSPDVT